MPKKILYPGDFITNEEEFLPSTGTYAEGGKVCAASIGEPQTDIKTREATLKTSIKQPKFQYRGQEVIGVIEQAGEKAAFVKIIPTEDSNYRYVPREASTVLRVSDIKRGYVDSLKDELLTGDIIRARIFEVTDSTVKLTTDGNHLGAIKAFCSKCRGVLKLDNGKLKCSKCGHFDRRKITDDYLSVKM